MGSDAGHEEGTAPSHDAAWVVLRVVPLALLATVFAARLPGLDLHGSDRFTMPLMGVGLPVLGIVLWLLGLRFPDQETLAGAARVVTILAVMVVPALLVGTAAH